MVIDIFIFIFGAMIGSFLNVLIYRLPREIDWVKQRSHCPHCKTVIPFYRNIPIVTFAIQLGKCHFCQKKINPSYFLVEILSGVSAIMLLPGNINLDSLLEYFFFYSIFCSFLVHFIVDVKHKILPNEINAYLAMIFLTYGFFRFPYLEIILGGLIGFGFPYLVAYLFYKLKGIEGLGGGDIKLYGALGLYLGPQGIIQNIFMSCILGSLIGVVLILFKVIKRDNAIPFGPFIIIAAFVQIFFPFFMKPITNLVGF